MKPRPHRPPAQGRDEHAATRPAVLAALASACLCALAAFAQAPTGKVLIVNSDAAVGKYTVAQQAFRESLGLPVTELNLAGLTDSAAERAIRAESPTAVYAIGTKGFLAASRAAKGRPIVLSSVINWQRLPAAASPDTHVIATELPSGAQLGGVGGLEHDLEVEDALAEAVERVLADDGEAGDAGLARAGSQSFEQAPRAAPVAFADQKVIDQRTVRADRLGADARRRRFQVLGPDRRHQPPQSPDDSVLAQRCISRCAR